MILDTSAILAVLENEEERDICIGYMVDAPVLRISSASFVEAGIVLESRYGKAGHHQLLLFLARGGIEVEVVDRDQADIALRAYSRFGKGKHRAALNYGNCFSYALAVIREEPLLFKGDDFSHTDLHSVNLSASEPGPS